MAQIRFRSRFSKDFTTQQKYGLSVNNKFKLDERLLRLLTPSRKDLYLSQHLLVNFVAP